MELEKIIYKYLNDKEKSFKQSTYYHYIKMVDIYLSNKNVCLKNLNEKELNNIALNNFGNKRLSYSTMKLLKSLVNRALKYAYDSKFIKKLLQISVCLKQKEKKKVESLTVHEVNKLESYIIEGKQVYKYGFLISLYTGLRIGELLSLKWENIDLARRIIMVESTLADKIYQHKLLSYEDEPKSETSIRMIPISKNLLPIFKELKKHKNSEYVIISRKGGRVFIRAYQESFSRCLSKLGIRHYGFHSLRHTFATRCYQNGMDIKTLSEILGHSTPSVTLNTYVHSCIDYKLKSLDEVCKKINKNIEFEKINV